MKFTIGWLKEHLDTRYKDNKIIEKLTDIGLEVENFGNVNSEKKIEKVSREFESIFLHKPLSSMRKTVPKSGLLDSFATDMYKSMMDEEIAKEMSKNKGMGMGEMIYNDLSNINRVSRGQALQSPYTASESKPAGFGMKLKE